MFHHCAAAKACDLILTALCATLQAGERKLAIARSAEQASQRKTQVTLNCWLFNVNALVNKARNDQANMSLDMLDA